ncbi:hypothetical protein F4778DRAFT_716429 [Xylariomycetidae sp. FL2044]|nr:hypothetical protein F4778DRAFT_716429 [Xylariomycetidae sp. FL2044]
MMDGPLYDVVSPELRSNITKVVNGLAGSPSKEQLDGYRGVFAKWMATAAGRPAQARPLVYCLCGSSDNEILSSDALSPEDATRLRSLQGLGAEAKFDVFLAQLQKKMSGGCVDLRSDDCEEVAESEEESGAEHYGEIDTMVGTETTRTIQILFDIERGKRTPSLQIELDDILQGDVFEGAEPDEEGPLDDALDEQQSPGFYGMSRSYRSLALIMIPSPSTASFLSSFTLDGESLDTAKATIEYFAYRHSHPGGDDVSLPITTRLCSAVLPRQSRSRGIVFREEFIVRILEAAVQAQNRPLFEVITKNIKVELSPHFFSWAAQRMQHSNFPSSMLGMPFDEFIFSKKTLIDQYVTISSLGKLDHLPPVLRELVLSALDKMVATCYDSTLYEQDGETLVLIACSYRNYDWVVKLLGPLIRKRCQDFALVMGFTWQLFSAARQNQLAVDDSFALLKSTLKSLVAAFDVARLVSVALFQHQQLRRERRKGNPVFTDGDEIPAPLPPITHETLTHLCEMLLDFGMEEEVEDLAVKLGEQSERIEPSENIDLHLPFFRNLIQASKDGSMPNAYPVFCRSLRLIILSTWERYVGKQPRVEAIRLDNLLRCGCTTCSELNDFLTNTNEKRRRIRASGQGDIEHCKQVLREIQARCYSKIVRRGAVHEWDLEKPEAPHEAARRRWEGRVADVRARLGEFDQPRLARILGAPEYREITGALLPPGPGCPAPVLSVGRQQATELPSRLSVRNALGAVSHNVPRGSRVLDAQPRLAGQKRKYCDSVDCESLRDER